MLRSKSVTERFQCTSKIESQPLYLANPLTFLLALNFLIFHHLFETGCYKVYLSSSRSCQCQMSKYCLQPPYADRWAKWEQDNVKYLSNWNGKLKELVRDRISGLKGKFKQLNQKILNDPGVKDYLSKLYEDFVLVPADKQLTSN